ncbi:hypothetical protein ACFQO4_20515 [Saliphagus sp. GCM10025334]
MDNRTQYAFAVLTLSAITVWLIAAPTLGLPIGVLGTDGGSMGEDPDEIQFNVWIDAEPEIGDVVLFEPGGELGDQVVSHRVVAETDDGYQTKGDANNFIDQDQWDIEDLNRGNQIGVAIFRIRLEHVVSFASVTVAVAVAYEIASKRS